MDVELTPLLHENPSSSKNADSKSKKWPVLTAVHRFRMACALALERHAGNAHDAGKALLISKEWSEAAISKARNLLQFIREWHHNLITRGHIFDEDRCVFCIY